jgi:hypothetical protein
MWFWKQPGFQMDKIKVNAHGYITCEGSEALPICHQVFSGSSPLQVEQCSLKLKFNKSYAAMHHFFASMLHFLRNS